MKKRVTLIILLTLAVRIAAIFILRRHLLPEFWEYDQIAKNIIAGKGYVFSHLNTEYWALGYPLYPFFSSVIYSLTNNNYFVLELFNVLLSGFISYFIYRISKQLFDEQVGLLSAFIVAIHPGLIIYATKLHELVLVNFFACLIFWYSISCDIKRIRTDIIIGILVGIASLLRPTMVFFYPLFLLYKSLKGSSLAKILRSALIIGSLLACVIAPWIIRNYSIHKQWTFITTSSAEHLWRGNNAFSTGTSLTKDNKNMFELAPKEFMEKLYSLDEIGQYNLFITEALKFIRSNPYFFGRMLVKKFFYFWWFYPHTGIRYEKIWKDIYVVFYAPILVFFLIGVLLAIGKNKQNKAQVIYLGILLFFMAVVHSLYYIEIRHRWMVEPLIIVISGYGLMQFLRRLLSFAKPNFHKRNPACYPILELTKISNSPKQG